MLQQQQHQQQQQQRALAAAQAAQAAAAVARAQHHVRLRISPSRPIPVFVGQGTPRRSLRRKPSLPTLHRLIRVRSPIARSSLQQQDLQAQRQRAQAASAFAEGDDIAMPVSKRPAARASWW